LNVEAGEEIVLKGDVEAQMEEDEVADVRFPVDENGNECFDFETISAPIPAFWPESPARTTGNYDRALQSIPALQGIAFRPSRPRW